MGRFSFLFPGKKSIFKKVDNGIDQIKHGVYARLSKKYIDQYGQDEAGPLAAAVTNVLFSLPPINKEGKEFLDSHKEIVKSELSDLKNDEDIRQAVTNAIRIKMNIIYSSQESGAYDKNLGKPYVKLLELGLANQKERDLKPKEFIIHAERFYKSSV